MRTIELHAHHLRCLATRGAKAANAAEKRQLEAEWAERIEKRRPYEVKRKSASVEFGHGIPHRCPAGFTVKCPLPEKFKAEKAAKAQKAGIQPVRRTTPKPKSSGPKLLIPIMSKNLPAEPGAICKKSSSVHFDPDAGIRYEQELPYGTPEHDAAFDLRTNVEGYFGFVKTGSEEADMQSRRRLPGCAAQYLL